LLPGTMSTLRFVAIGMDRVHTCLGSLLGVGVVGARFAMSAIGWAQCVAYVALIVWGIWPRLPEVHTTHHLPVIPRLPELLPPAALSALKGWVPAQWLVDTRPYAFWYCAGGRCVNAFAYSGMPLTTWLAWRITPFVWVCVALLACVLIGLAGCVAWVYWPRGVTMKDWWTGTLLLSWQVSLVTRLQQFKERQAARWRQLHAAVLPDDLGALVEDASIADKPHDEVRNDVHAFATKWAHRARTEHCLPADTEANRLMVAQWFSRVWKEKSYQKSLRARALPLAINYTFLRNADQEVANAAAYALSGPPGLSTGPPGFPYKPSRLDG